MYLEIKCFNFAYNRSHLETVFHETETGGGARQGQGRKELQADLRKHVETAQFTSPSSWKVNTSRNSRINQCMVVAIFNQLSWICKIATSEKWPAKLNRHMSFLGSFTLLPDTSVNADSVFISKKTFTLRALLTHLLYFYITG